VIRDLLDFPTPEALVKDLVALRMSGLRGLRKLELPALRQAALLYNAAASPDIPATIELLLRQAVDRLGGGAYGHSALLTYGLTQGTRATSSKIRRELAAAEHDLAAETFRKTREIDIREDVASNILQILIEHQERRLFVRTTYPSAGESPTFAATALDEEVQRVVLEGLIDQFVAGEGFRSQRYGEPAVSLASTGACAHAICGVEASAEDKRRIITFICEAIEDNGTLPTHHYRGQRIETTWAASQCLLALGAAPEVADATKARGLAQTLLRRQSDLGWHLRRRDASSFEPLLSIYPLLSLIRARKVGWIEDGELMIALRRLDEPLAAAIAESDAHPARRLLAEYERHLVGGALGEALPAVLQPSRRLAAINLADPDVYAELSEYTVITRAQPLWYAKLWRPALYLITRRLYPLPAQITVLLGAELLDTFSMERKGWGPGEHGTGADGAAFTWTTALGMHAVRALGADLEDLGLGVGQLQQLAVDVRRAAWR
jgi:hypothetical protein